MELNEEQIIKALECCTRGRKSKDDYPCDSCPYNECNLVGGTDERQISGTCQGWLMKDAIALIRELTEENDSLQADNEHLTRVVDGKLNRISVLERLVLKLTEENDRLMREKTALECVVSTARNQAKADTVRKMQMMTKKKILEINCNLCGLLPFIDQIAKEVLEGNDEV